MTQNFPSAVDGFLDRHPQAIAGWLEESESGWGTVIRTGEATSPVAEMVLLMNLLQALFRKSDAPAMEDEISVLMRFESAADRRILECRRGNLLAAYLVAEDEDGAQRIAYSGPFMAGLLQIGTRLIELYEDADNQPYVETFDKIAASIHVVPRAVMRFTKPPPEGKDFATMVQEIWTHGGAHRVGTEDIADLHAKYSPSEIRGVFESIRYTEPAGFHIQGFLDQLHAAHSLSLLRHDRDPADHLLDDFQQACITEWAKAGIPVYAVEPDVAEALELTDLPDDYSMTDVGLPHKSVAIILPDSTPLIFAEQEFTALLIGIVEAGSYRIGGVPFDTPGPMLVWRAYPPGVSALEPGYAVGHQIPLANIRLTDLGEFFKNVPVLHADMVDASILEQPESDLPESPFLLLLKILMFIRACPGQIRGYEFIKRYQDGETQREVRKPGFIGKKFRLRSAGVTDEKSARMHWRRGHFRLLDGKRVWVEPAIVNPPTKEDPSPDLN
jgi:hypothetical protein